MPQPRPSCPYLRQLSTTKCGPGLRLLGASAALAVGVLGTVYVVVVGPLATRGYEIRSLQQQLAAVKQAASQLEVQVAEQQAQVPVGVGNQASYVAVGSIEYLAAAPAQVGVAVR